MLLKYPKSKINSIEGLSGIEEALALKMAHREEKITHLKNILSGHVDHDCKGLDGCGLCVEAFNRLQALEVNIRSQEPF